MKKNTKRAGSLTKLIDNFNSPKISEMQNLESSGLENFIEGDMLTTRRAAVANAIQRSNSNNALMTTVRGDFRAPASAAQMNFLVYRATANIASTLYVPLFGALDRESDYVEAISSIVPSGVTWTVSRNQDKKSLDFTFTQTAGGAIDIVTVSCNEVPYVNYLLGMLQNVIQLSQIKLQISDVAKQAQFSLSHHLIDNSQYGSDRSDKFTPNSFKSDLQNQNDIRIINSIMDFDAEKCLVVPVTNAVAFTYTINAFVNKYEKSSSRI